MKKITHYIDTEDIMYPFTDEDIESMDKLVKLHEGLWAPILCIFEWDAHKEQERLSIVSGILDIIDGH